MHFNMKQTFKILVILIIYSIVKQSEGITSGITHILRPSHSATFPAVRFVASSMAKTNIHCSCLGYFKMALCPTSDKRTENMNDGYVCCSNCTIQMLYQFICPNGTDPNLPSMEQEETHNGNEYDRHCNGNSFVWNIESRVYGGIPKCVKQAKKICPSGRESNLSQANKSSFLRYLEQFLLRDLLTKNPFQLKILNINHRNQARKQILKANGNKQRPEAPKKT